MLQRQLDMEWQFAQEFVLDGLDQELVVWEPSAHVITVHRTDQGWRADWPDEENPPIPNPTIGWLLWHVEWWWTSTLNCVEDRDPIPPEAHLWSGGTDRIVDLKRRWDQVLVERDLDDMVNWFAPDPQTLGFVASWVNFELAKNLSEMNMLKLLYANRS